MLIYKTKQSIIVINYKSEKGMNFIMINFEVMSSEDTYKCIDLVADSFQDYEYFSLYISNDFQRKKS